MRVSRLYRCLQVVEGFEDKDKAAALLNLLLNYLNQYPSVGVERLHQDLEARVRSRGIAYDRRMVEELLRRLEMIGVVRLGGLVVTLIERGFTCSGAIPSSSVQQALGGQGALVRDALARELVRVLHVDYYTIRLFILDVQQLVWLMNGVKASELITLVMRHPLSAERALVISEGGVKPKRIEYVVKSMVEVGLLKLDGDTYRAERPFNQ
jgi:hypothetical protein